MTPTTLPNLSSLPDDPVRRQERLESIAVRPGPETRKPLPPKLNRVETAAATAAAVVGMLFSTSSNVLIGGGGWIDENQALGSAGRGPAHRKPSDGKSDEAGGEGAVGDAEVDASQLVPWVRLPSSEPSSR